jgi:hypothetical protein
MREVAAAVSGELASGIGGRTWETRDFGSRRLGPLDPRIPSDVSGMPLSKAYTYLGDVQEHKQIIPFRRFAGGIGRASQAKQFKTTKGESATRCDASNRH